MAAGGTPGNVKLGAGRLYYAPLGTAEPVSASAILPSAWQSVGYTEAGTEFASTITSEDVEVAEELDPIDNVMTKRSTVVNVEMAESTKKNLLLAHGGGAGNLNDGTAFELPDPSAIVGVMLIHDSSDTAGSAGDILNRRTLVRSAKPSGNVTSKRAKPPAKATITASFTCTKPDATTKAVKFFPDLSGRI